jgi:heptosyltransferase-2
MIGDVLVSTILFDALKKIYPDSQLHYLINSHTYPVVENHPNIDGFLFFTPQMEQSKSKAWILIKNVRAERYDLVIDVYSKLSSTIITLLSGTKKSISFKKSYTSFLYSDTVKHLSLDQVKYALALHDRLQLLSPLGIKSDQPPLPKIYLSSEEKKEALLFLKRHGIKDDLPIMMISVLGSGKNKTYPFAYMASILDFIITQKPETQILFNYIPKQYNEAREIYNACNEQTKNRIFIDVFADDLRAFLAVTSQCNALIGNEGGAINMAKALDIPTFSIYAPWIRKESWDFTENDSKNISVHLNDFKPKHYKTAKHPKELKSLAEALYLEFEPEFLKPQLREFLQQFD